MKNKIAKTFVGILCILLLSACASAYFDASGKRITKEEYKTMTAQNVRQGIANGHFRIDIDMMQPLRGMSRHVSSGYYVQLSGDTLKSYLPYIGVVHRAPYGGGKGLNFDAPVSRQATETPKLGLHRVQLVVKNEEDTYLYQIDVFENGSASVFVQGQERESITFSGGFHQ